MAQSAEKLRAGSAVHAKIKSGEKSRMRPYPEYTHSGVEWLGEIPCHWTTVPVKGLYQREKRTNHPEKELLSVYRDYGVIPKSSRDDNNNKESDDLTPYQLVRVDDLVMNKMKAWQGSIAISEYEGIVSPAYYVYRPRTGCSERIHPRYVHYLLRNPAYITQYMARSKGIRVNQWDLDPGAFEKVELLLPSKDEQERIFRFLDRETARIDNLIAEKQNFINLLKEKRQALINHVVTKGLDPKAKMKDSGIEWIGEVPERWVTSRLKFHITNIIDTEHKTIPFVDESSYLVVRTSDIREGELLTIQCRRTDPDSFEEWTRRGVPSAGDVILTREAPAGEACLVPEGLNVCLGQRTVLIRTSESLLSEYLVLVIYSDLTKTFIDNASMGSTVKHLNMADIPNIPLFLPDLETQAAIMAFTKQELGKIDQIRTETLSSIKLLDEHRTALISAAVTGKIDVRNQT